MQCLSGCLSWTGFFPSTPARASADTAQRAKLLQPRQPDAKPAPKPVKPSFTDERITPGWTEDRESARLDAEFVKSLTKINARGVSASSASHAAGKAGSAQSNARSAYGDRVSLVVGSKSVAGSKCEILTDTTLSSNGSPCSTNATGSPFPSNSSKGSTLSKGSLTSGPLRTGTAIPVRQDPVSGSQASHIDHAQTSIISDFLARQESALGCPEGHQKLKFCSVCGEYYLNIRRHIRQCHCEDGEAEKNSPEKSKPDAVESAEVEQRHVTP
eukprot:gnl/TRDRNA2_/TRDRNA2_152492_c0_seq1.p1 gnl/TRDRNA2_/TRDRNA2_152492_c0~~gnl/TRDRNA2_/TRDRNA2_152492_c0_seq1.p1  ORF type:complete len:271 (-),score=23.90 gnl/TRDRNA2_/TRDRNA2_152492_c0_seq1:143-955(-)